MLVTPLAYMIGTHIVAVCFFLQFARFAWDWLSLCEVGWHDRLKVTDRSMLIHIAAGVRDFEKRHVQTRKKTTRKEMEELSEMAALVDFILREAVAKTPLKEEDMLAKLVGSYKEGGDVQLLLELNAVLHEKAEHVNLESISLIKEMLAVHSAKFGSSPAVMNTMSSLEADNFEILQKQVKHDVKAVITHLYKFSSFQRATYWSNLEKEQAKFNNAKSAAKALLGHATLVPFVDIEDTLKKYLTFKNDVLNKPYHKVTEESLAMPIMKRLCS